MLPEKRRDDGATGKYADSAVTALLALMTARGCRVQALRAMVIGGAQILPMGNPALSSIGEQNVAAARKALMAFRIPIVYEETGGKSGRSVLFDNVTGEVVVKTLQAVASRRVDP
jgi:chemotaxis protein CheD